MNKKTIRTSFKTQPSSEEVNEILVSLLISIGYEGFETLENETLGYIPEELFNKTKIENLSFTFNNLPVTIKHTSEILEEKNWNKIWEESFQPVIIKGKCIIHAGFHKIEEHFPYKIMIDPKMAFGTGHHETTKLVMESMLELDFSGKNVLDMGCGTGILAILASQLGAKEIIAIDNDEWAYQNTLENVEKNNCRNIKVFQGDAGFLDNQSFEIIIANINRNILLQDMEKYSRVLISGGLLILSGFYIEDIAVIKEVATKCGLIYSQNFELKNWICMHCIKEL